ncbi:MAG TPA: IS110 family transposase [Bryobacteraceae bacterium]|nr:IS110 family transposase [Bryobacteraceae bacterium]
MSPTTGPAAAVIAHPIIYLGMDVHKDSITMAALPQMAKAPTRLDKLPNELPKLRRWLDRAARDGELRACYKASGAGYVLHRALLEWGYACEVIAPSLIPKRPGVQRKHDKRDAADLARLYRAGELTAVRIPTEAEERVRDVVRCRETFQREIHKSRHYILKFLARRGFVFREGTNWCTPHLKWLQHLTTEGSLLAPHDRLVFREYHALLLYKLQRRDDLDREIERLAELPMWKPAVARLQCFRGISLHSAMVLATEIVDWRRFERPSQLACYLGLVSREDSSGDSSDNPPAPSPTSGRRSSGSISASTTSAIASSRRSRRLPSPGSSSDFSGPSCRTLRRRQPPSHDRRSWSGVWRRGSMCEHSRRRYAACRTP